MILREGLFVNLAAGQVEVMLWDAAQERFLHGKAVDASTAETLRRRCLGMDLDKGLAPYPMQQVMQWMALSNCILPPYLEPILPVQRMVVSAPALAAAPASPPPASDGGAAEHKSSDPTFTEPARLPSHAASSAAEASSESPDPKAVAALQAESQAVEFGASGVPGTRMFFTHIPGTPGPRQAPAWRTAHGVDPSGALAVASARTEGGMPALLCQLQVAFLSFYLTDSLQGFNAWKALLNTLCRAEWCLTGGYEGARDATPLPPAIAPPPTTSTAAAAAGDATSHHVCPAECLEGDVWVAAFTALRAQVSLLPDEFAGLDEAGDAHSFVTQALRRLAGTVARYGSGVLSGGGQAGTPHREGSPRILLPVERAACQLINTGERTLKQRLRPVPAPREKGADLSGEAQPVEMPADGGQRRLTRAEVIALLGDEWDGDDEDDVPVIVDAMSKLSIS